MDSNRKEEKAGQLILLARQLSSTLSLGGKIE